MTDSMDGSLLSVKSVGSKKKGHRRMASKERKAIIADITEDTDQELIPEGNNIGLNKNFDCKIVNNFLPISFIICLNIPAWCMKPPEILFDLHSG